MQGIADTLTEPVLRVERSSHDEQNKRRFEESEWSSPNYLLPHFNDKI